jgi:hypothetical protein
MRRPGFVFWLRRRPAAANNSIDEAVLEESCMLVKAMGREPTSEPLRRVQLQRKRLFLSPKKECGPNYRAEADHANARTLTTQWLDMFVPI